MKNRNYKFKALFSFLLIICLLSSTFLINADASYTDNNNPAAAGSTVSSRFAELIFGKRKSAEKNEEIYLCPGGDAFGVKICGGTVTVSRVIDALSDGELRENDVIKSIDGKEISTVDDVKELLRASVGDAMRFEILRDGKRISVSVKPKLCAEEYHLGVILKDGATGIGTVTYYDPESGRFGGLGHGICAKDGKEIIKMTEGQVTGVILSGASRGEANTPGELRGVLTDKILGELDANTECGVFGTLDCSIESTTSKPIAVGKKNAVTEGEATILTTVRSGKRASYSIEISDIDYSSKGTKSFKIHVTDDALIAITGGIVRGMSGSPIIQDGKLVGAVTHVMVADPTEGYGIFIENMLNASENIVPKAA